MTASLAGCLLCECITEQIFVTQAKRDTGAMRFNLVQCALTGTTMLYSNLKNLISVEIFLFTQPEPLRFRRRLLSSYFKLQFCLTSRPPYISPRL
ncbi:hypothetical protein J1C52_14930, partial [Roseibaca sp. Y0-43]|nr:hypothetical protein [Roseibaca sp. Y0-43]